MKKTIMTLLLCIVTNALTQAQKNFYETIVSNGTNAVYEGFKGKTAKGDGTYTFTAGVGSVKLKLNRLTTGQPVGFIAESASETGRNFKISVMDYYGKVDSYPNVMTIKNDQSDDGYMMIDDLLFVINDIPDNAKPKLQYVSAIYIMVKDDVKKKETTGKKKKKIAGFMKKMKSKIETSIGRTPAYKRLTTINIEKKFNDYVEGMLAKQKRPKTSKDRNDLATIKGTKQAKSDELKRYNDSVRASPKYQAMLANNRRANSANKASVVTLRNNGSSTIYVSKSTYSSNPGTEIRANSTSRWDCTSNGYLQIKPANGGVNGYTATSTLLYKANTGCGRTVNIN